MILYQGRVAGDFLVVAGQAALPPTIPTSYWKFNTSLVKEDDFLPSFTAMWTASAATRARGACPAAW